MIVSAGRSNRIADTVSFNFLSRVGNASEASFSLAEVTLLMDCMHRV